MSHVRLSHVSHIRTGSGKFLKDAELLVAVLVRLSVCVRVHMCVSMCAYMYISLSLSLSVCVYIDVHADNVSHTQYKL